jgi:sirohydrochlorin cobaltochelatase
MMTFVILATHGSPPRDFPPKELREFFELHVRFGDGKGPESPAKARYVELESKMRAWKRNSENDPFYVSSLELAKYMEKQLQLPVFTAFNEFCAPTVLEAICDTAEQGADRVIVVSSMLTRGGEHAEVDIREAVQEASKKYPETEIVFAFPFPGKDIARFLSEQVRRANS